jgi:hypothetical protein
MKLDTPRQRPVLLRLQVLLDDSMAVSRAIFDNTFEDVEPLPKETYEFISDQLKEIDEILLMSTDG